jgi:hypothetical protein
MKVLVYKIKTENKFRKKTKKDSTRSFNYYCFEMECMSILQFFSHKLSRKRRF